MVTVKIDPTQIMKMIDAANQSDPANRQGPNLPPVQGPATSAGTVVPPARMPQPAMPVRSMPQAAAPATGLDPALLAAMSGASTDGATPKVPIDLDKLFHTDRNTDPETDPNYAHDDPAHIHRAARWHLSRGQQMVQDMMEGLHPPTENHHQVGIGIALASLIAGALDPTRQAGNALYDTAKGNIEQKDATDYNNEVKNQAWLMQKVNQAAGIESDKGNQLLGELSRVEKNATATRDFNFEKEKFDREIRLKEDALKQKEAKDDFNGYVLAYKMATAPGAPPMAPGMLSLIAHGIYDSVKARSEPGAVPELKNPDDIDKWTVDYMGQRKNQFDTGIAKDQSVIDKNKADAKLKEAKTKTEENERKYRVKLIENKGILVGNQAENWAERTKFMPAEHAAKIAHLMASTNNLNRIASGTGDPNQDRQMLAAELRAMSVNAEPLDDQIYALQKELAAATQAVSDYSSDVKYAAEKAAAEGTVADVQAKLNPLVLERANMSTAINIASRKLFPNIPKMDPAADLQAGVMSVMDALMGTVGGGGPAPKKASMGQPSALSGEIPPYSPGQDQLRMVQNAATGAAADLGKGKGKPKAVTLSSGNTFTYKMKK